MKSKLNKVSIIIPVYNAQKYLGRCIESILAQTHDSFELILVNDGSKDDSLAICNNYAQKDNRIKVVDKQNEGAGMARNAGLEIATGEYVLFIDADDWIVPEMVEQLLQLLINADAEVSICNYFTDQEDGTDSFTLPIPIEHDPFITDNIPQGIILLEQERKYPYLWNRLYKRDIIEQNHIWFEKQFVTGQDLDFNLKYFRHVKKCVITNAPYYHYIKDGVDSLCARYKEGLYGIVTELSKRRKELYAEFGMLENEAYRRIYEKTHVDYIRTCIPNMFRKKANFTNKERLPLMKEVFGDSLLKQYIKTYEATDGIEKIFKVLVKIGSVRLALMVYTFLFWIRNDHSNVYQKIRG